MMLVVRALKINQLADGGMPPTCDSAVVAGESATKKKTATVGKIVLFRLVPSQQEEALEQRDQYSAAHA
jgi:hypothetical protein